jgi:CheY-like chemotaxis protein
MAEVHNAPFPPQTVAIVDDDVRIRTLLKVELEDLGAQVTCFRSAEDALAGLDPGGFDLVLLDIGLPDINGIACLDLLRQRGLRAHVVLMSAHWEPQGEGQIRALGADRHVVKTALPGLLVQLMAEVP